MVASLMLDNALARLDGALGQLEAAARRRIEAERSRANLETELALMQDDRARLAADLDGAMARLGHVETAAADVDQRLQRAMNVIGAVIERVEAQQPAEPEPEPEAG
jgi:predicted  nucleic acid-binding Zn-ribbon protein